MAENTFKLKGIEDEYIFTLQRNNKTLCLRASVFYSRTIITLFLRNTETLGHGVLLHYLSYKARNSVPPSLCV